jgi:hypothetical protein
MNDGKGTTVNDFELKFISCWGDTILPVAQGNGRFLISSSFSQLALNIKWRTHHYQFSKILLTDLDEGQFYLQPDSLAEDHCVSKIEKECDYAYPHVIYWSLPEYGCAADNLLIYGKSIGDCINNRDYNGIYYSAGVICSIADIVVRTVRVNDEIYNNRECIYYFEERTSVGCRYPFSISANIQVEYDMNDIPIWLSSEPQKNIAFTDR